MKKILLIDGMALLFRSFYATSVHGQFMKRQDGTPTNGIHGFIKHVLAAIEHVQPTHVIACWDMGSTTFRTASFDQYKANRAAPPEELRPQFELVKEVTTMLQIPNVGLVGYEADDCIGTLARQYESEGDVYILTGDTDLLQLADIHTTILLMKKGIGNYEAYTPANIVAEKGVHPWQIVHVKAFMGDTSDNYPGVKGIGEKTAYKLIQQFQTVQGVLDNLEQVTKGQRAKIEADIESLHTALQLAEIHCEVPISCELEAAVRAIEEKHIYEICEMLEWKRPDSFLMML